MQELLSGSVAVKDVVLPAMAKKVPDLSIHVCVSVCLCVCASVCLSVCVEKCVCLCVCNVCERALVRGNDTRRHCVRFHVCACLSLY